VRKLLSEIRASLAATVCLSVILCGIYPLLVWLLAQGLFPDKANGSLVTRSEGIVGSSLIAQMFTGERYFHPRPSAAGEGYDAASSGGSNLGPISRELVSVVERRVAQYREVNHLAPGNRVPVDAVTASASGLDPDISVRNALLQAPRVAGARGLSQETVRAQIEMHTKGRSLWVLGEPRVNVLELNIALDGITK